ncbi:MAG: serine--tRNA ligase [Chloroflexi bacterium]|nr:serine--tRNA ligase [Chloroflexota bacterium]
MLNLKVVREHPEVVQAALEKRHTSAPLGELLQLDEERRRLLSEVESLRAQRNQVSQQLGRQKERPPELIAAMREVGERIKELDGRVAALDAGIERLLLYLPNIPEESVPVGADESENVVVRRWGTPRGFHFEPRAHWDLGEALGIVDFPRGAKIAGARSWVLKGDGARLNRALIAFMLDLHTRQHGYAEVATPYLVKPECMVGTGQFPKFVDEAYTVCSDELVLIPTAEVPVTNLYRDEILAPGVLPIYHVCHSACFRREAGAAGRDTRGLIRVHQFDKVELVKLVEPASSDDELERLVDDAEEVLRALELPHQVKLLCTGDLGFASARTYDPEVWMPGQGRYVEISSCSNFLDFQARRASIRYRPAAGARPEFVHTLNGSGLAVGRTLAAVLEYYQQPDGSVVVPPVLRPYLSGQEVIRPPAS